MSGTVSTIVRPAVGNRARGSVRRLFRIWTDDVVRFFLYRAATKSLRELNDRELRDIGLVRSQIESAVHGFITPSDQARM